jgi:acid phosphatase (class A)
MRGHGLKGLGLGLAAALSLGVAAVWAQTAPPPAMAPQAAPAQPRLAGYLGKEGVPNSIAVLPPPPADGSLEEQNDLAVFMATRKLAGTPRWTLAAKDAVDYFGAFECPLGLKLSPETTPKTYALMRRLGADASAITNLAKDHYQRHRPLWGNSQPICTEDQRASLLKSASYPSGHATFSWAAGLVLAEMVPDKATEILARARAFGESRVVCGVHYVSDIEEGRANGSALVAALHADPEFQADLKAAKAELQALRTAPHAAPDAAQCTLAEDAEQHTPWINPTTAK